MEVQRKVMVLQQRVKELENENSVLRQRLSDALSGKVNIFLLNSLEKNLLLIIRIILINFFPKY